MDEKDFKTLKQAIDKKEPILVSGCLLGMMINYQEKGHLVEELRKLLLSGQAIAICPEVLGGLPTPRDPSEIQQVDGVKKIVTNKNVEVTEAFQKGAQRALDTAKTTGAKIAILKSQSPSCGVGKIYDGTFTETLIDGDGIAAALFKENGIRVITEDDFCDCIK